MVNNPEGFILKFWINIRFRWNDALEKSWNDLMSNIQIYEIPF